MASDRKCYQRALRKWDAHRIDGDLSVPEHEGDAAILCTYAELDAAYEAKRARKDIKIFRKEAFAIADELWSMDKDSEVILNAKVDDVREVLTDPSFSDVYIVGHGTLAAMFLMAETEEDSVFDWMDVSEHADHLKQGAFVQRTCGLLPRNLNVPLWTFAMADHRDVFAPVGASFVPRGLLHPMNELMQPVSEGPRMSYTYVNDVFRGPADTE